MKKRDYQKIIMWSAVSTVTFFFLLLIHFSCQENEADEVPAQNADETVTIADANNTSSIGSSQLNEFVGAPISNEIAERWINNYLRRHPDGIRSHFFGAKTFDRLLSQPDVIGISIEYAINDEGIPQLLLVGVNKDKRKMMLAGEEGYDDVSNLCPPDCSKK